MKNESQLIKDIAKRAAYLFGTNNPESFVLDINATHYLACPLDLERLANAPDADFGHDIAGINQNLNRLSFELENCFLPRYARSQ